MPGHLIAPTSVLAELVLANRMLAHEGILDGYGHVSARCDDDPQRYLIGDASPPGNVRAQNVFRWNLDNEPVGHTRPTYGERFIHGCIYRARPDVQAIVHCHAPALIPFTVSEIPLRPIFHMAGFQGEAPLPVFEIRDRFGPDTAITINTNEQGNALAESLGERAAVLMRGHGATIVATSVPQAVLYAVYAVLNAQMLTTTLLLGAKHPTYVNDAEGRNLMSKVRDGSRTWDYLAHLIEGR
ncbi:MAG: class II aldolase/adducin family protein [Candidatus Lustribacter sp.]